jgi:asparagine synthase (glutamine-hydrolysing)
MYIKYGFIYDSDTIFKEVHKLQAGHFFAYFVRSNIIRIDKYWDNNPYYFNDYYKPKNIDDAITHMSSLLEDAVKIRVPTDKKIGMGISSGTDSFSIFSILNENGVDIPLFNARGNYDEYPEALKHVQAINPEKTINAINISYNDYEAGIKAYTEFYEEPNSDFSCSITNLLFREMHSNSIKVHFSGTGADDIFFGKPSYEKNFGDISKYRESYSGLESLCKEEIEVSDCSYLLDQNDLLSMQRFDMKSYLQNLLVKEDIAASHYNIDIRTPFLDYRLVEFLNTLPIDIIYHNSRVKYLLKKWLMDKYNINFFESRKIGFSPNLLKIGRTDFVKSNILATVTEENVKKYFPEIDYTKVSKRISNYSVSYARRSLINLYFYIAIIDNYYKNIFGTLK